MSSPVEQFPAEPDDPDDPRHDAHALRRRRTLQEQAQATLAKKVARAAESHRKIATATARRARDMADLQQWSSDPVNAKLLNPDYAFEEPRAFPDTRGPVLTDAQASPRKIAAWEDQEVARRTVTSEVACALRLAERTAENLIGESAMFAGPMRATLTAMGAGEISYRHGQVLMEQLSFVPFEEAAELEAELLPAAKDLTAGKLRVKARRLRERRHPETLTTRAAAAVAERGIWWEGRPDGMGTLTWYGTAQQTQAAHDRLIRIAEATRVHERADESIPEGQRRTIGQICADALADLVLDGVTPSGTGGGIQGQVLVTVPVFTAMGTSDKPGFLDGYGPIPADAAREIAAGAPSFARLLTHPETGAVLSVGKDRYTVPADLRRWLRLRDGTCRFPGCTRPATRSDIDHTTAWEAGGPTDYDNLAHLCAPHHRLKHQTLWSVVQEPGGVLVWTSPAGATHRTYPETTLGPPPTQPPTQPVPPGTPAESRTAGQLPEDPPEEPPF
ncbi:HNH endonuclease signature motif containing protein [Cryobacterium arcticum]|uniref:HNH endonuclease n=1 Tax=Cryobacterium arcticum TaxID=670052 RepID=A0A1B1BK34_9MICO|nr:HNH endonuclease signature motif containing protein [Cryobacterium arcticum]ANP72918.1 HNH endonuclease [Cryobacterium arcticum]